MLLPNSFKKAVSKTGAFFLLGGLLYYVNGFLKLSKQGDILFSYPWVKSLGISLSFNFDSLAAFFSILICLIGSAVFLYADAYLKEKKLAFSATLLFFTASMLGLVQAQNTILFFIFWELTSVSSFMLIAHSSDLASAKESSRTALFVTVGGGLSLLAGLLVLSFIGQESGLSLEDSLDFSKLASVDILGSKYSFISLILISMGVATKSAQFPFHFWLPLAMSGPAPVSSFLHSATMVKAGIFLMLRIFPFFSQHILWSPLFVTMGMITMISGAILCISQKDFKNFLAYSTIGALGVIVMLIGVGTPLAVKAGLSFLLAHAFYKACLFQVVGNLELSCGSKNLMHLFGMGKVIRLSAIAAGLAAFSFCGVPPFLGYYGKELSYLLGFSGGALNYFVLASSFFSFVLMGIMAFSLGYYPFWKKIAFEKNDLVFKKLSFSAQLPPLILALIGLVIGVVPSIFTSSVGSSIMSDLFLGTKELKLKLWHGFDWVSLSAFSLSMITIIICAIGAYKVVAIIEFFERLNSKYLNLDFKLIFNQGLASILEVSNKFKNYFQNGSLLSYIRLTVFTILLLVFFPAFSLLMKSSVHALSIKPIDVLLIVLTCLPLVLLLRAVSLVGQVIYFSLSGFGIIILFSFYSAIDLGITQLSVEALSILFILLLIKNIPKDKFGKKRLSYFDLGISFSFSFLLLILFHLRPLAKAYEVSDFYIKNSLAAAYGRNIVNVILVDFRSLDTFGEVIVIAIAAIGVMVLLGSKKRSKNA
ncbi:proton-conducting transporter membrane subunit [bacterium]|nr:proton-conducting transporter membrane subunit [bacterium]